MHVAVWSPRGPPCAKMVDAGPLVGALGVWRDFNLEEQRGKLDAQGLSIAENQQQSQKSRKSLAERTRG